MSNKMVCMSMLLLISTLAFTESFAFHIRFAPRVIAELQKKSRKAKSNPVRRSSQKQNSLCLSHYRQT